MISNKAQTGGGKKRVVGLDLMRIALAFLIYLFHSNMHFKCDYHILNGFIEVGAIAMTGFFLLSGYALHLTYSNKNLTSIGEIKVFYIKRLITILPLYYFIAIAYSIYGTINGFITWKENVILFPVELLCLQSTFSSLFSYTHNGGTWFISCIVICYALYPFLQYVLLQLSNKSRVIILLWAPIVQILFSLQMIYSNPFFRLLEFPIGIIIAQINSTSEHKVLNLMRDKYFVVFVTFIMTFAITITRELGLPADCMLYNWIALPCFICLLIPLGYLEYSSLQDNKYIIYLSGIAFTFFIIQIGPVWKYSGVICSLLGNTSNMMKICVSFLYCLIGAVLIHELVEKPSSNYLRRKLLYQKTIEN